MKSSIKKGAIAVAFVAASSTSYIVGDKIKNDARPLSPVEKIQASGKKQWVAYQKTGFGQALFQAQSKVSTLGGVQMKRAFGEINGFTFEGTDVEAQRMVLSANALGLTWEVVEDRVYKLPLLAITGCSRKPPPNPSPIPDPRPTPAKIPWGIKKIQSIEANVTTKAAGIKICVVDTGTDRDHPDIASMLAGGASFVSGQPSWDDNQGHGTHVAGTIAAQDNERDVIGVAQPKIITAKVLDYTGMGMGSWIANGIVFCVKSGAKIISMSLGSPASAGPDRLISDAIAYAHSKGVKTVCAAGNDGGQVGWPAQGCTYAVGATDDNDRLAYFSSRGPTIDVLAPGVNVLSLKNGGGVVSMSGTSMATPHVSGALALAMSVGRELRGDKVTGIENQGIGRVNAKKSVEYALPKPPAPAKLPTKLPAKVKVKK